MNEIKYICNSWILSNQIYKIVDKKDVVVLDVGCNNGDWINLHTQGLDNISKIIGIDVDPKIIAQANSNAKDNQRFYTLDCESPDFYEKICDIMDENNISGFDYVCLSMLLMHLSKPFALIRNIHKLMKVGGRIFVNEEDDSLVLAHPDNNAIVGKFIEISDFEK